jgi:hypothetical protein
LNLSETVRRSSDRRVSQARYAEGNHRCEKTGIALSTRAQMAKASASLDARLCSGSQKESSNHLNDLLGERTTSLH